MSLNFKYIFYLKRHRTKKYCRISNKTCSHVKNRLKILYDFELVGTKASGNLIQPLVNTFIFRINLTIDIEPKLS